MELTELGEIIWKDKYAGVGETFWRDTAKRVATSIASVEPPATQERFSKQFYDMINMGDFCPGGRILYGAGRPNANLLNCYLLDPSDNVESIGKTIMDTYKISCAGGGIGFNFTKIRPKGDSIQNIPFSAPGSISLMKMINEIGEHVRSGKNRRTALMAILNVTHPDLLEFLSVKLDLGQLTNFNISVGITDRFIEAVEKDEDWHFTFGGRHNQYFMYEVYGDDNGKKHTVTLAAKSEEDAIGRATANYKYSFETEFFKATIVPLKARDLWNKIISNAIECGEPGIFNLDFANSYTNVAYFEDMPGTNPCGEEVLPPYGNCDLGHINLSNMVKEDGETDWTKLARTVRLGVRFLDNVLTVNNFPISECREVAFRSRRIGLGVTGLHYYLIKRGLKYGSEKSLEEVERLFSTIRNEAYKASMNLAKEKGSFEAYSWENIKNEKYFKTLPSRIRTEIKKHGLRNAVLLTVAPTGTISMVLGVSTGIEPIFSPVYYRRWKDSTEGVWRKATVLDPLFKDFYLRGKKLDHFVGAYDVSPEEHIKMQAVIQQFIDSAVSKTCNLPHDFIASDETMNTILDNLPDVKGFTFYRAGSRGNEPLEAIDFNTIDLHSLAIGEPETETETAVESIDSCKSGACEI